MEINNTYLRTNNVLNFSFQLQVSGWPNLTTNTLNLSLFVINPLVILYPNTSYNNIIKSNELTGSIINLNTDDMFFGCVFNFQLTNSNQAFKLNQKLQISNSSVIPDSPSSFNEIVDMLTTLNNNQIILYSNGKLIQKTPGNEEITTISNGKNDTLCTNVYLYEIESNYFFFVFCYSTKNQWFVSRIYTGDNSNKNEISFNLDEISSVFMADIVDENIFIVTNQDQKISGLGYAVIYKIINNETIINIVLGPSLNSVRCNIDIIAAKAIYFDILNSIIYIGVLDRTNKGLSVVEITINQTNFNTSQNPLFNTLDFYNIINTGLIIKEAFYDNFFSLNVTNNQKDGGIYCNILLISKNTPFYQFSIVF